MRCHGIVCGLWLWYFLIILTIFEKKSKQSSFASDKTTNMQFSAIQNKIYGSLVTIQYHIKCTTLFTQILQAIKLAFIFYCYLNLAIVNVFILISDKFSHPFIIHCLYNARISSTKCTDMTYLSQYDNKLEVKHLQQLQH